MSESECGEVVKTGYLVKSPPLSRAPVSQWHRRWFKLMDSKRVYPMAKRFIRLDYYQSEADAKSLADPKGEWCHYKVCISTLFSLLQSQLISLCKCVSWFMSLLGILRKSSDSQHMPETVVVACLVCSNTGIK